MPESLKIALLVPIYLVFAPLAGLAIRRLRIAQQVVFFLMLLFTVFNFRYISTSPGFPQDFFYRGHTRGYECTLMEVMAVILIFSGRGKDSLRGPFLPPGLWIYLLYCFVAGLSIFTSVNPNFTMMAIVKFTKIALVGIAAFHFIREEKDICFWLYCSTAVLMLQAVVCLYFKYVGHVYQVRAWFEHQNSMVMYTYMLSLPLLAAAMAPGRKHIESIIYGAGYIASGICVFTALSRAGMAAFSMGTGIVVTLSLLDKLTIRRMGFVISMGLIGTAGLVVSADTIIKRFEDTGNTQSQITRDLLNESSRQMIAENPFFGTGWNTYGIMINPPYNYGDNFDAMARAYGKTKYLDSQFGKPISESWYYLVAAETGIPSFLCLIAFLVTVLFWCLRIAWRSRRTFVAAVAIGLFAGLGMNYLQSLLERVLTQPKNAAAWMICLAVVGRMEWWRRQRALGKVPLWLPAAERPVSTSPTPAPSRPNSEPAPQPAPVFQPTPARVLLPPPSGAGATPRISILPPV